ncbi:MAG: hypothetical protein WC046_09220, partial [Candidatus Bathyarchaeia archaeon]
MYTFRPPHPHKEKTQHAPHPQPSPVNIPQHRKRGQKNYFLIPTQTQKRLNQKRNHINSQNKGMKKHWTNISHINKKNRP